MLKIDPKKFAQELKAAADYLAEHKKEGGCYSFYTVEVPDKKINKNVSIVLGWSEGWDPNDPKKDKYQDDEWRLETKIGYQCVCNMSQCDYEIDFNQVYDAETGDVYDSAYPLYEDTDFEKVAQSMIDDYNYIISSWKSWEHE